MLFDHFLTSVTDWYSKAHFANEPEYFETVAREFQKKKADAEEVAKQSERLSSIINDPVLSAFDRIIELAESKTYSKDFYIFFELVGRALREADRIRDPEASY